MSERLPDWPPPAELAAGGIRLTASAPEDAPALFAALDDDAVWAHVAGRPASAEELALALAAAPAAGRHPWVVWRGERIVGTTSFLDVSLPDRRIEIGHTAYEPPAWGSEVNPAAKLALMQWAFGAGFTRVQMKTDIRNLRSRSAIAGLGAREEGVLRRYQRRADGSIRDTVMFSVVVEEWPAVRDRLRGRLEPS